MAGKRCGCGQGHETFGACIRAKNLRVGYCRSAAGYDATKQKKWDAELAAYRAARSEGIQPDGTQMHQIETAKRRSDDAGAAYGV